MPSTLTPFTSVLVANRGEIALRVMKTARALGLRVIGVYTEADADALHVDYADDAVLIGEGPVGDSYLDADKILAVAKQTGAGAVHPGYGFLSERADFAEACAEAGLVFVGPSANSISVMGNKAAAKRKMNEANVPCVPGYEGEDQSDEAFQIAASSIGFPVMIKAAAGGGGRGMRLVDAAGDLTAALALARSESANAFGSDEIILEKAIIKPRHVEVQVFADRYGTTVHLGERDCSVQRRHQKVVEEAPCPIMTSELRERMGQAAVEAARSINYEGAGTVEFLLDGDGHFYFLEMNTRLQVEHPVTELVTGLDLVALQFAVAQGNPLGLSQDDVALRGHAIEVRLYAEDPANDFLPSTGMIELWQPATGKGLRVDEGIRTGQSISPFYDPMLAKIIAHGATREDARQTLVDGLKRTILFGPANNRDFLIAALSNDVFARGEATTAFIGEEFPNDTLQASEPDFTHVATIAALIHRDLQKKNFEKSVAVSSSLLGWCSHGTLESRLKLGFEDHEYDLSLRQMHDGIIKISAGETGRSIDLSQGLPCVDGICQNLGAFLHRDDQIFAVIGDTSFRFQRIKVSSVRDQAGSSGTVTAPMHGNLIEVRVEVGDKVEIGAPLIVLEAMKMQHQILAEVAGTVTHVNFGANTQVKAGDLLIELDVHAN